MYVCIYDLIPKAVYTSMLFNVYYIKLHFCFNIANPCSCEVFFYVFIVSLMTYIYFSGNM
jgi:hypothetical protein